ncbi:MAG: pirin family protein, partial [Pedobacter sp.]|nr:pirin family protein [Pedobacter sp.]
MAQTVIHRANTRGVADHGWLKSYQSFSFAGYYNPDRINFGALRVLNDDIVTGGMGFGEHPHDNMEIISIPLEGELQHKDSMGNVATIKAGEIQVMSAGTGIYHSEYNSDPSNPAKFLQIWLFPNQRNVKPRYDQIVLDNNKKRNEFIQILSPNANDAGVWIYQNAWFNLARFDKDYSQSYSLHQ